ncbi:MAG: substrate-binding domain-containing protein, partial [Candidatus Ventricola sp.]
GRQLARRGGFTAICVSGDQYAAAVMAGLREGGARVPEDISIVGFDDTDIARMCTPPLTTIHQDGIGKGERAAQALFALIAGQSPDPKDFTLPVELVIRGTTAQARR